MHSLKLVVVILMVLGLSACGHHRHHKKRIVVAPASAYIVVNKPVKGKECWKTPRAWHCR